MSVPKYAVGRYKPFVASKPVALLGGVVIRDPVLYKGEKHAGNYGQSRQAKAYNFLSRHIDQLRRHKHGEYESRPDESGAENIIYKIIYGYLLF